MSIAILINVHDGIVLAADSASTVSVMTPQGGQGVATVYNHANKIANLYKGKPIGCIAFGAGSIGNASLATLFKDFRVSLAKTADTGARAFDIENYTIEDVANALAKFLEAEYAQLPRSDPKPPLGLLLAGYSTGRSLGEGWSITFADGKAATPVRVRAEDEVGITWGGEAEAVARLVLGHSPHLADVLSKVIKPNEPKLVQQLLGLIRNSLQVPLVLPPMPIQDATDLAEFLVHASIMFSRFTPGPPSVGGPIEIAAITKHEGFKWIRRKHYYDLEFNREVANA